MTRRSTILVSLIAALTFTSAAAAVVAAKGTSPPKPSGCSVGSNAAPLSQWRWEPRSRVTVYAHRGQFRPKEEAVLALDVKKWDLALRQSLSGIRVTFGGETDSTVPRTGELFIIRDRLKLGGRQVGEFRGVLHDALGYVTAAVVVMDSSIDDPRNVSSLFSHELGHGFGLWDCETCGKRSTVMNQFKFPGRNMAESPSICDVLQVGAAYAAPPPAPGTPSDVAEAAAAVTMDAKDSKDTGASALGGGSGSGDAFIEEAEGPELASSGEAIRGFLRAEAEVREELKGYTFLRDVLIQTVDDSGVVSGEYRRVSRIVFDDAGRRVERVISFPEPTLKKLNITPEDLSDLSGVQPFGPDISESGRYRIRYGGEIREGGERFRVLRFKPTGDAGAGERAFSGEVWVRPEDSRVVRVRGRSLPDGEQRFPFFETRRESVDGGSFFPVYTYADDVLRFPSRRVRMRMTVRYSDYRRFRGKVSVIEEGEPGREK
jgi:hypothetical protein